MVHARAWIDYRMQHLCYFRADRVCHQDRQEGWLGVTGGGGGGPSDQDHSTKQYVDKLSCHDPVIPRTLSQICRSCMQRAMAEFGLFGYGEAGTVKFAEFCEWAAGHPSIAPTGHVNYNDKTYRVAMNQLLQNVAKKAHKSRQTMWEAIADARAAFTAANHGVVIEPVSRLPDCGNPTADTLYMLGNTGWNKAKPSRRHSDREL